MRTVAVRKIERASPEAITALGELGLDLYGMRPKFAALGLVYVDRAEDLD